MNKPYNIPQELEQYTTWEFPREALEEVIANQDKYTPELLKVLEHFIENYDTLIEDYDYMAPIYALFLLAQFREKSAYPLIIKLFSIPDERTSEFFNDVITEDLNSILASVYDGNLDGIKSIIENEKINEYVCGSAMESMVILHLHDKIERDEVTTYLTSLWHEKLPRDKHHIWTWMVLACMDLHLTEFLDDIKQAYADNLVDTFYTGLSNIEKLFKRNKEDVLKESRDNYHRQLIDNTITELENWASFQPPITPSPTSKPETTTQNTQQIIRDETIFRPPTASDLEPGMIMKDSGQIVREGEKVGRNDPCPCGSGKKYKKCCGKRG